MSPEFAREYRRRHPLTQRPARSLQEIDEVAYRSGADLQGWTSRPSRTFAEFSKFMLGLALFAFAFFVLPRMWP